MSKRNENVSVCKHLIHSIWSDGNCKPATDETPCKKKQTNVVSKLKIVLLLLSKIQNLFHPLPLLLLLLFSFQSDLVIILRVSRVLDSDVQPSPVASIVSS